MPLSQAQQERRQRRRQRYTSSADPEHPTAYTRSAVSTEDVPATAAEVVAWIDAAPSDDEMIARAEAAAQVNGERAKPWASVQKVTDGILG